MAATLLVSSCSQEKYPDMPDDGGARQLCITVTDGGYAADSKNGTRAVENGYTTEFSAGDICGLYIVRDGTIVYNNVKLTATTGTDGSLSWQPEAGVTLSGGLTSECYFLYYPYQADMTGKVTASAADDAGFFAPLIDSWQPKTDQSDYTAGYTASDLMTAMGTASEDGKQLRLSFSMTHRMALAVIIVPSTTVVYHFTNTTSTSDPIPDYTVLIQNSANFFSEQKPCRMSDGSYRYIVSPEQVSTSPLEGSYAAGSKDFTVTPNNLENGKYKTYRLTGETVEKNHNLQIGDFLLTDGSLVGKDENLTPEQQANVSAIVFWTPAETDYTEGVRQTPASLTDDKIMAAEHPNCTHGLAVAVKNAGSSSITYQIKVTDTQSAVYRWQTNSFTHARKEDFVSVGSSSGSDENINRIYGYQNTVVFRAYNVSYPSGSSYNIKPVTVLDEYANTYPAPVGSTGWFLPSAKELHMLCYKDVDNITNGRGYNTREKVNSSLSKVGGYSLQSSYYWTSTEYGFGVNKAYRVNFANAELSNIAKTTPYYVRGVCAF